MAEADFSYGDGTVKSINVPCTGGGFNVGVEWDDAEKGGPVWSEKGGGRASQHLLVIGPAEDSDTGGTDGMAGGTGLPPHEYSELELKAARFKQRFSRSPTQSEAELSEGEWDELGEEEYAKDGEAGGKEGGDADAEREAAGGLAGVVKTGARIKIAMGMPCKWYGALVGDERDDGFEIGFDDGEVRLFSKAELQATTSPPSA